MLGRPIMSVISFAKKMGPPLLFSAAKNFLLNSESICSKTKTHR